MGGSDMNSTDVVESPPQNIRKRMSYIPIVNSPAMAMMGKGGTSRQWHVGFSGSVGFLF